MQGETQFTQIHSSAIKINGTLHFVEMLAYDSVWALALALNRTMNAISNNDTLDCGAPSLPLHQFSYGNSSTACIIRHSLRMTNFPGLSVTLACTSILFFTIYLDMMCSILLQGLIQFDSFGARQTNSVNILQYRPSNGECHTHLHNHNHACS